MKPLFLQPIISNEENIFSLSISDLMTALLLVFILILSGISLKLAKQQEENRERLDMISVQEEAKRRIIAQLKGEMDQFDIEVDPKTGAIRIKEAILFEFGRAELKKNGKQFLHQFIPRYVEILFAKREIREQIGQVIIEGHTDNIGDYLYNMKLSMDRAYNVVFYVYSEKFANFDYKDILRKKLSADGRSFVNPISANDTKEGRSRNRRVEFKFSFKDWTILQNEQFNNWSNNEYSKKSAQF
jgi:chemotaxis protein MotB